MRRFATALIVVLGLLQATAFAAEPVQKQGIWARTKATWKDPVTRNKAFGKLGMAALTVGAGEAIDHVMKTRGAGMVLTTAVSSAAPTIAAYFAQRRLAKSARFKAFVDAPPEPKSKYGDLETEQVRMTALHVLKEGAFAAGAGVAADKSLDLVFSAASSAMGGTAVGNVARMTLPFAKTGLKKALPVLKRAAPAIKKAVSLAWGQAVGQAVDTGRVKLHDHLSDDQ